eukprot:6053596-Amphidinium_carterae.1
MPDSDVAVLALRVDNMRQWSMSPPPTDAPYHALPGYKSVQVFESAQTCLTTKQAHGREHGFCGRGVCVHIQAHTVPGKQNGCASDEAVH